MNFLYSEYHFEPISMNYDGSSLLAVGRSDGKVSIILVTDEKFMHSVTLTIDDTDFDQSMGEQPQSVESVKFQPDSNRKLLACGCVNGIVKLFEQNKASQSWILQRQFETPDNSGVLNMKWFHIKEETGMSHGGPRILGKYLLKIGIGLLVPFSVF